MWACQKIGVMNIDAEPFRSGVERGWNSEKYTKNTGTESQLTIYEFETNFITEINSTGCC